MNDALNIAFVPGEEPGDAAWGRCLVEMDGVPYWYDELDDPSEEEEDMLDLAFGLTKRAMNQAWQTDLFGALEAEAYLQEIAGRSHDNKEGVAAFLEKRGAQFKGM